MQETLRDLKTGFRGIVQNSWDSFLRNERYKNKSKVLSGVSRARRTLLKNMSKLKPRSEPDGLPCITFSKFRDIAEFVDRASRFPEHCYEGKRQSTNVLCGLSQLQQGHRKVCAIQPKVPLSIRYVICGVFTAEHSGMRQVTSRFEKFEGHRLRVKRNSFLAYVTVLTEVARLSIGK